MPSGAAPAAAGTRSLYFGINVNTRAWGNPATSRAVVAGRAANSATRYLVESVVDATVKPGSGHVFRVRGVNAEATEPTPAEYSW